MRILAAFLAACLPCLAASTFRGLEPGVSTRADVERALGQAQAGGESPQYSLADESGQVYVTYRGDVVERIDYRLATPVPTAKLYSALKLSAATASEVNPQGQMVEYFGEPRTLAMVHAGNTAETDIASISYCSQSLFDQLTARFRPVQPPPITTPPQTSDAGPGPYTTARVEQYNPAACRDIYDWAQGEQKLAEKSKSPERRHAILTNRMMSQRGDCQVARSMATEYRNRYR